MRQAFLEEFLEQTGFPTEAKEAILEASKQVDLTAATETYLKTFEHEEMEKLLGSMEEETGISRYTLWMLLLISAAEHTWDEKILERDVFWQTFTDLRYKALECYRIHGVWGTFVGFWYPIFFQGKVRKLGRLEYEDAAYLGDAPVQVAGRTIHPGDPIKMLHIPSSGEPFCRADRLASYAQAEKRFGSPLICFCDSWLLYPPYGEIFGEASNIQDFQNDFQMLRSQPCETFHDGWRVYGRDWEKNPKDFPEDTTLQRKLKQYFLNGGTPGTGFGVLVFENGTLLTRP